MTTYLLTGYIRRGEGMEETKKAQAKNLFSRLIIESAVRRRWDPYTNEDGEEVNWFLDESILKSVFAELYVEIHPYTILVQETQDKRMVSRIADLYREYVGYYWGRWEHEA